MTTMNCLRPYTSRCKGKRNEPRLPPFWTGLHRAGAARGGQNMAPSVTLSVLSTREGAMFEVILPDTFVHLCTAFKPCFTAPTQRTFQQLVTGWIACLGRRTITAVAVAAGVA